MLQYIASKSHERKVLGAFSHSSMGPVIRVEDEMKSIAQVGWKRETRTDRDLHLVTATVSRRRAEHQTIVQIVQSWGNSDSDDTSSQYCQHQDPLGRHRRMDDDARRVRAQSAKETLKPRRRPDVRAHFAYL